MTNFDNLTPQTSAFIDVDNSIEDLQQVLTSGAVTVTATSSGVVIPIGEATTPKFENISPWKGAFLNPDNELVDLMQFLTSGAIQVQVIGGGGGGGAPTTATYITQANELIDLPNSIPLSNLSSGLLANTTGTGDLTPVTLTGTANQLIVSGGDGSSTPTFSISPTLVLPGTMTLGGVLNTAGYTIHETGISGSMNLVASTSIDLVTPWVSVNGLRHSGENTNMLLFGTQIIQLLPDNSRQFEANANGVRLLNGPSVNAISIDGTFSSNSDSILPTQKSAKTYVDTTQTAIKAATFITTNNETAMFPNSTSTSGLANGFAMVYSGLLQTQVLTGTANQINVAGGDASLTNPVFSLSSTLVTPGTLNVGTTFSVGGTGSITSITTNPSSVSANALMPASTIQAAISAAITAGTSFRGGWDASGGLYPTTGGSGGAGAVAAGDWWYITVGGTLNTTPVNPGDQIFALVATPGQTDANWLAVGEHVSSVFGRNGAIVATSGDYSFSLISGTAAYTQGGTGLTSSGTAGNILTSTGSGWASSAPIIPTVFGRTGAIVATSGDYSFSLISGIAGVAQGGTGITAPGAAGNVLTSDGAGNWVSSVAPSAPVSSVFGRTGAVVATSGDYSFSLISGTAAVGQGGTGLTATGADGNVLTASGGVWVSSAPTSAPVTSVFGRTGVVTAQAADYSFSLISGTALYSQGGTGITSYAKGDIIHASAINTLAKLLIGTTGQVLTVASGDVSWADPAVASVFGRTGAVVATSGDYSFSLISGTAAATQGGTGQTTYTIGDLLYASSSSALSKLAGVATGNVLLSGGIATAPAWGKVDLTAAVSGILPLANGGTGNTSNQAASVANAVTFNNGGAGAASGTTFDGSAAKTISYNTVGASPLAGSASLTTVGTIATGTWHGTAIAEIYGGTNQTTYTAGDLLYSSASNTLSKLGIGTTGQILKVVAGLPAWSSTAPAVASALTMNSSGSGAASGTTFDGSSAITLSYNTLGASPLAGSSSLVTTGTITSGTWHGTAISEVYGGTNQTSYTAGDLLYSSASNTLSKLGIGSTNQVLTVVAGVPAWANATGGGLTFNTVTASTQAMAVNNIYYSTYAGTCVMTLPSTAATGSIIRIITDSSHVIQIAQNSGQLIYCGAQNGVSLVTTTGTGGSITTVDPNTVIELTCIATDTTWIVSYANNNAYTGV